MEDGLGFWLFVTWVVQGSYNAWYTRQIRNIKKQLQSSTTTAIR